MKERMDLKTLTNGNQKFDYLQMVLNMLQKNDIYKYKKYNNLKC